MWQWCFFSFISLNFDDQLSSNVYRFVILCILFRDTQAEKTGLWQLPIVSSVFKRVIAYSTFEKMPKKRSECPSKKIEIHTPRNFALLRKLLFSCNQTYTIPLIIHRVELGLIIVALEIRPYRRSLHPRCAICFILAPFMRGPGTACAALWYGTPSCLWSGELVT